MPDLSPETIYRVFRDLLDEAPASLRPEIEALLARAEAGEKTDNQLLRLARRDPTFCSGSMPGWRWWMARAASAAWLARSAPPPA
jgi:hypothetical protein